MKSISLHRIVAVGFGWIVVGGAPAFAQPDQAIALAELQTPGVAPEIALQTAQGTFATRQTARANEAAVIAMSLDSTSRESDVFGARVEIEDAGQPMLPENATEADQRRLNTIAAIQSLRVVGVAPERMEAYVGSWVLRPGSAVNLLHNGETFSYEVVDIATYSITFEEAQSGLRIIARLGIVPDENPEEMIPIN